MSHALGSVTNNNGCWIGQLDLLGLLLQLHAVTNNSSQSVVV
jgi:hypothetical protein